jgi:hypothetical protein
MLPAFERRLLMTSDYTIKGIVTLIDDYDDVATYVSFLHSRVHCLSCEIMMQRLDRPAPIGKHPLSLMADDRFS